MSEMHREPATWKRAAAGTLLFVASLAALYVGGFIQFDDTSGFGGNEWNMPLAFVAGLLAFASVAVAVSDRTARRALGAALVTLDVLLVGASVTDGEFRFIWGGDEGELFYLEVVLGLAALILLTPTFTSAKGRTDRPSDRSLSPWSRVTIFATVLVIAMFVTFNAGISHFHSTQCSGRGFDGECDLAVLEGLAWAGATFFLLVTAFSVSEVQRARRLRTQRQEQGV